MEHTLTLTNGAAHVAIACLQNGLTSIDDIYIGGLLMLKFRPAKKLPKQDDGEKQQAYEERISAWMDSPFGDGSLVVDEAERDALKTAMKELETKKALPSGPFREYVAELIALLGLNKPQSK